MKTIKLLLLLWIVTVNTAIAKKGIYLSLEDFIGRHVSYEGSKKIILNRFSGASNIRIIENDQVVKLEKDKVFGYTDGNGQDFRFFHNEGYQIFDHEGLFIYKAYASSSVEKGKGWVKKSSYYFSAGGNGTIYPLTIENLKKAFPENLKFHDLLDGLRSEADLTAYDEYRKMVKVNYLYKMSVKAPIE
ncbi:hypothetical protein [Asinibacterium sp. OR53]|uniref:hypothetical protein n=1 Tax=Asinibacterium sp. OR53 TaxID=925409 RepID=UPI00047C0A2E|nr:hypothetical protein [Asinibacterium sp. OR53]